MCAASVCGQRGVCATSVNCCICHSALWWHLRVQQAHKLQLACSARENSDRLFSQRSIIDPQHKQTKCQAGTERLSLSSSPSLCLSLAIPIWRKLSLRDSGTVTSYDNNSTHLCHMDQAKPPPHQQQQQKAQTSTITRHAQPPLPTRLRVPCTSCHVAA